MIDVMPYDRLPESRVGEAWKIYRDAMEPTRSDAVQRHMLHRTEFDAIAYNTRFTNLIAYDKGVPCGVAAYTRHLDAYDWIEPRYFEWRWPDAYKRNAIFYVLFVCTAVEAPADTFPRLVRSIVKPIRDHRGMGALDWSQARVDRGLARASRTIIARDAPLMDVHEDAQHFSVYEFDWDQP